MRQNAITLKGIKITNRAHNNNKNLAAFNEPWAFRSSSFKTSAMMIWE